MDDSLAGGRVGWWTRTVGSLCLVALLSAPERGTAFEGSRPGVPDRQDGSLQVRVWLDRGEEPVLERGERARLYYRASRDAYVTVFHVNTDGIVRLVHPRVPDQDHYVRGGRDYRLLFPRSPYWFVDEDPGVGYFFAVGSRRPFDWSSFRYSSQAGGWDLSAVGRRVYRDPYVAMDDYVEELIPDWRDTDYALDFVEYHVGERHRYPRFVCYECHGFRPYQSWNPYRSTCRSFRLVIDTDPYFYPASRYRESRVVFTRPPDPGAARFTFKERADGEPADPLYRRVDSVDPSGGLGPARRRVPGEDDAAALEAVPGGPSRIERPFRPSDRAPSGSEARRGRTGPPPRPVLRRRPTSEAAPTPRPERSDRPSPSPSPDPRPDTRRPPPLSAAGASDGPGSSSRPEPAVRRRPPDA